MAEIALAWDAEAGAADLVLRGGGLALDAEGLEAAVLASLFSEVRAGADIPPPDGNSDRRGWWSAPLGSGLWLAARGKNTGEAALAVQDAAERALAWLVRDGLAERVSVRAERQEGRLALFVAVDGVRFVF